MLAADRISNSSTIQSRDVPVCRQHAWRGILGRTVLTVCAIVLAVGIASAHRAAIPRIDELPRNYHVVEWGQLYRSAQPDARELESAIRVFGIRTVLNLRGKNERSGWYHDEADVCSRFGVELLDRPMKANALPESSLMAEILNDLHHARYPMLVHCSAGADRTGAISAIYRMAIMHDDPKDALDELSVEFLHFRSLMPCMDTLAEAFDMNPRWIDRYAPLTTRPCSN